MDTAPPAAPQSLLKDFPPALITQVEHAWEQYLVAAREQGSEAPRSSELLRVLYRVWSYSEFIARSCIGRPALLPDLLHSGDLLRDYGPATYSRQLATALRGIKDEQALGSALRHIRQREMVRIAWRDLAGWADLAETLQDLSLLAEAIIAATLERLHHWQCRALGTPYDESGKQPQQMVVLAMGKLGARELNFSSDVDLIFAYPAAGETRGRRPRLSNEEFFIHLGQRLITLLDTPTAEGRVYRVDMRLRPYGNSGPLAMSFDALEEYYQSQGREWERYAMIKARPMAGDLAAGEQLLALLRPFVYRRYLDYNALAALREMKAMINREVSRKSLQDNIKIGPGGIREIEFIGQVFQLIRGGREPALRVRGILEVLRRLGAAGHLPAHAVANLSAAYVFLRRTENRLQAYADRQTHVLPRDEEGRQRLALSMGFSHWPDFESRLAHHRHRVREHFEEVFASPQGEDSTARETDTGTGLGAVWLQSLSEAEAQAYLAQAGFTDAAEALRRIHLLRDSYACRALSHEGRSRLDRLMPLLLAAVAATSQPDLTLPRLLDLIEAVARRTTYLALLEENPMALSQLVRLCAASPWIAQMLRDHPLLLDELLDPRSLYAPLERAALEQELEALLARIPCDDQEQQLETLRYFKQANVLRVAAADLMEVMPLMEVSDHLTAIAEVALHHVLQLAVQHLRKRHRSRGEHGLGFAIIGYGKLGGIELGYGSDLDLVFLHEAGRGGSRTFYFRLGQRIIHMLNAHTPSGVLYEVDMRLRPSGASGLLVSSLDAFAHYQAHEAWTWEHQALVRARFITGDPAIGRRFTELRHQILTRHREPQTLKREVVQMRERMREELARSRRGHFDVKQGRGGLADIEFIVQYGVLQWAHRHPDLTRWTDNLRLLADFARHRLLKKADVRALSKAYQDYRQAIHRLALQEQPAIVDENEFRDHRQRVTAIWDSLLGWSGNA